MAYHSEYHGVRLDVYADDAEKRRFNVEMQVTLIKNLLLLMQSEAEELFFANLEKQIIIEMHLFLYMTQNGEDIYGQL